MRVWSWQYLGFGLLASKSQQNKFPLFKGIQFVVLCYGTLRKPIHWTKEGEPSVLNPSPGPSAVITSLRQQVSEVPITISFLQKESWMVREFHRDTVTSLGLQTQVGLAPALSPLPFNKEPSLLDCSWSLMKYHWTGQVMMRNEGSTDVHSTIYWWNPMPGICFKISKGKKCFRDRDRLKIAGCW